MSGNTVRRLRLLNALSRRRYDTVSNLAVEFSVSERTIRRDIDVLSAVEPIYTQTGRYSGGVYVVDGYFVNKVYLSPEQERLLNYIIVCAKNNKSIILTDSEISQLSEIIKAYSKPRA